MNSVGKAAVAAEHCRGRSRSSGSPVPCFASVTKCTGCWVARWRVAVKFIVSFARRDETGEEADLLGLVWLEYNVCTA